MEESSLEGFHFFISFQLTFTLTSLMLLVFASTTLNASHCRPVVTLNGELVHPLHITVHRYDHCEETNSSYPCPVQNAVTVGPGPDLGTYLCSNPTAEKTWERRSSRENVALMRSNVPGHPHCSFLRVIFGLLLVPSFFSFSNMTMRWKSRAPMKNVLASKRDRQDK